MLYPVTKSGKDNKSMLYPVTKSGKWGYVNNAGELVVDYRFLWASPCYESRVVVEAAQGYFLLDTSGSVVRDEAFDYLHMFSGGLCSARSNSKGFGWLERGGRWAIEPMFDSGGVFHEGLACTSKLGQRVWIDVTGGIQFAHESSIDPWRFVYARSLVCRGGKYGYINRKGREVGSTYYDSAYGVFIEGKACVKRGDFQAIIDLDGETLVSMERSNGVIAGVSQSRVLVVLPDKHVGIFDMKLNQIADLKDIHSIGKKFQNGLIPVLDTNGKKGFVNVDGEFRCPPLYDTCDPFEYPVAAALSAVTRRWSLIDTWGRTTYEPEGNVGGMRHEGGGVWTVERDGGQSDTLVREDGEVIWTESRV